MPILCSGHGLMAQLFTEITPNLRPMLVSVEDNRQHWVRIDNNLEEPPPCLNIKKEVELQDRAINTEGTKPCVLEFSGRVLQSTRFSSINPEDAMLSVSSLAMVCG